MFGIIFKIFIKFSWIVDTIYVWSTSYQYIYSVNVAVFIFRVHNSHKGFGLPDYAQGIHRKQCMFVNQCHTNAVLDLY